MLKVNGEMLTCGAKISWDNIHCTVYSKANYSHKWLISAAWKKC
jgi:hypothetical protein